MDLSQLVLARRTFTCECRQLPQCRQMTILALDIKVWMSHSHSSKGSPCWTPEVQSQALVLGCTPRWGASGMRPLGAISPGRSRCQSSLEQWVCLPFPQKNAAEHACTELGVISTDTRAWGEAIRERGKIPMLAEIFSVQLYLFFWFYLFSCVAFAPFKNNSYIISIYTPQGYFFSFVLLETIPSSMVIRLYECPVVFMVLRNLERQFYYDDGVTILWWPLYLVRSEEWGVVAHCFAVIRASEKLRSL